MATGKNAWAICERSGFRFPYKEMIFEPGTGLFVHYSESDGKFNRVDHPQNHIKGVSDNIALKNPRPDTDISQTYLVDEDGNYILGNKLQFGQQEYILTEEE
jgi:hypothetical protein